MPFSPTLSVARALDPERSDAIRVLAIGVSRYDDARITPVRSATDNAVAWLLQVLRMGAPPDGHHLLIEEAAQPSVLLERIRDLLDVAALSSSERAGLTAFALQLHDDSAHYWVGEPPRFGDVLRSFVLSGNNLRYQLEIGKDPRLLAVFSGHGAQTREGLVLCPADTSFAPEPSDEASLDAAIEVMLGAIRQCAERAVQSAASAEAERPWAAAHDAVVRARNAADERGVKREMVDVFKVLIQLLVEYFGRPWVIVTAMAWMADNIEAIRVQRGRGGPELGRVIGPIHLMILLGELAERVTLVLDTCHAGGPGALQGSSSAHAWVAGGLRCRILSASQGGQLAAEARLGKIRYSAATWALTRVLSRWNPIEDGQGYALGIRNGELVSRANMLLQALSFQQHLSLHAPAPMRGDPAAANMPFCGLDPTSRTTTEPDAETGSIQLSAGTSDIVGWVVTSYVKNGVTYPGNTTFLAVNYGQTWAYMGQTYGANTLSLFATPAEVAALATASSFDMVKVAWQPSASPPQPVVEALGAHGNTPIDTVPAVDDPGETTYQGGANPSGVQAFQKAGGTNTVYLRFVAASGGVPAKIGFVTKTDFPFTEDDFDGVSGFKAETSPGFDSKCSMRIFDV